ncbi:hypothetical protein ALC62_01639, partial [Cyphomyrmex costatus]
EREREKENTISGGVGVLWKKTEMRRTGRRMDSKGLATREKGDREEDRGDGKITSPVDFTLGRNISKRSSIYDLFVSGINPEFEGCYAENKTDSTLHRMMALRKHMRVQWVKRCCLLILTINAQLSPRIEQRASKVASRLWSIKDRCILHSSRSWSLRLARDPNVSRYLLHRPKESEFYLCLRTSLRSSGS